MAIYHLTVKPISRKDNRSTVACAAYRAGVSLIDERDGGKVQDYTPRKASVLHTALMLPGGGTADRGQFWNGLEAHHKRGDAMLSREIEASIPPELSADERKSLVESFIRELVDKYGVAIDVALHAPHTITKRELQKNPGQHFEIDPETGRMHNGNFHFHAMMSACYVAPDGKLCKKAVELDPIHCQRAKIENMADYVRVRWAEVVNARLAANAVAARIDHRTLAEQGIARAPTQHLGVAATGFERRKNGEKSDRRLMFEAQASMEQAVEDTATAIAIAKKVAQSPAVVAAVAAATDLRAIADSLDEQVKALEAEEAEEAEEAVARERHVWNVDHERDYQALKDRVPSLAWTMRYLDDSFAEAKRAVVEPGRAQIAVAADALSEAEAEVMKLDGRRYWGVGVARRHAVEAVAVAKRVVDFVSRLFTEGVEGVYRKKARDELRGIAPPLRDALEEVQLAREQREAAERDHRTAAARLDDLVATRSDGQAVDRQAGRTVVDFDLAEPVAHVDDQVVELSEPPVDGSDFDRGSDVEPG